jgi:hypothetical protein
MCTAGSIPTGPGPIPDGLIPVIVDCGSSTCPTSTFYKKS